MKKSQSFKNDQDDFSIDDLNDEVDLNGMAVLYIDAGVVLAFSKAKLEELLDIANGDPSNRIIMLFKDDDVDVDIDIKDRYYN